MILTAVSLLFFMWASLVIAARLIYKNPISALHGLTWATSGVLFIWSMGWLS
jgi:hypothetical protein